MKTRVLVAVKTYPQLSSRHIETVCTAGVTEDGDWIRVYPIPYRLMDKKQRFRKYQWIEADIERDTRDPRHESHRLAGIIKPLGVLGTADGWSNRKRHLLQTVFTDLSELIEEARDVGIYTSLAVFKPKRILRFSVEKVVIGTDIRKKRQRLSRQAEKLADLVPYRFYYTFEDENGRRSRLQITDWEIYQLCRKLMRKYGNRRMVIYEHLKRKYFDELVASRDVYFFLGTTRHWHIRRSRNPFMIVGVFYPPKE